MCISVAKCLQSLIQFSCKDTTETWVVDPFKHNSISINSIYVYTSVVYMYIHVYVCTRDETILQ